MDDLARAIAGLEHCIPDITKTHHERMKDNEWRHETCPYGPYISSDKIGCFWRLMQDSLVLLKEYRTMKECLQTKCRACPHCENCDVDENGLIKEQDAVKPISERHLFLCPVCKNTLFREQKFCHECGKRIEWEGRLSE